MALSAVEFGSRRIARADVALGPVERGLEILRAVLEGLESLAATDQEADVSETIALRLVKLGGFGCVVLWRVDGRPRGHGGRGRFAATPGRVLVASLASGGAILGTIALVRMGNQPTER